MGDPKQYFRERQNCSIPVLTSYGFYLQEDRLWATQSSQSSASPALLSPVVWANWWWYPRSLIESPVMTVRRTRMTINLSTTWSSLTWPPSLSLSPFYRSRQRLLLPARSGSDFRHLGHVSKFSYQRGKLKTVKSSKNVLTILSGGKMQNGQKMKRWNTMRKCSSSQGSKGPETPVLHKWGDVDVGTEDWRLEAVMCS